MPLLWPVGTLPVTITSLVAEALGTFGEIEKKPRSEGRGGRRAKVADNPSWDDGSNDTPSHKRRKTDPPQSPDGSPPQVPSPVLSESQMNVYTSNYSNLFAASKQHAAVLMFVFTTDLSAQGIGIFRWRSCTA